MENRAVRVRTVDGHEHRLWTARDKHTYIKDMRVEGGIWTDQQRFLPVHMIKGIEFDE